MCELAEMLAEISGMDAVTLQPAAGAQGELTGLLMIRAYHLDARASPRKKSSCPTRPTAPIPRPRRSPASRRSQIKSDDEGDVDLLRLERHLDEDVAALMMTMPNTLGLFEPHIIEVDRACATRRAPVYMDGANMNALLGIARPGDLGFDVMHFNLHKTFSTPHGGGGPAPVRSASRRTWRRSCRCPWWHGDEDEWRLD